MLSAPFTDKRHEGIYMKKNCGSFTTASEGLRPKDAAERGRTRRCRHLVVGWRLKFEGLRDQHERERITIYISKIFVTVFSPKLVDSSIYSCGMFYINFPDRYHLNHGSWKDERGKASLSISPVFG